MVVKPKILPATKAFKALSYTVSATVVDLVTMGFTADEVNRADEAYISTATAGVRMLWDGSTPTTTFGHYIGVNGTEIITGNPNLQNLRMRRESTTDSVVTVTLQTLEY